MTGITSSKLCFSLGVLPGLVFSSSSHTSVHTHLPISWHSALVTNWLKFCVLSFFPTEEILRDAAYLKKTSADEHTEWKDFWLSNWTVVRAYSQHVIQNAEFPISQCLPKNEIGNSSFSPWAIVTSSSMQMVTSITVFGSLTYKSKGCTLRWVSWSSICFKKSNLEVQKRSWSL